MDEVDTLGVDRVVGSAVDNTARLNLRLDVAMGLLVLRNQLMTGYPAARENCEL